MRAVTPSQDVMQAYRLATELQAKLAQAGHYASRSLARDTVHYLASYGRGGEVEAMLVKMQMVEDWRLLVCTDAESLVRLII